MVLVSVDTLRADHLSCYGHVRPTSPFIDGLAQRGVRFTGARSPSPWTLPAHVTLLSGLLSPHHLVVDDDARIGAAVPLLAESMAAGGFHTGGFVSTLFVSRKYGFERGFEHFDDFRIRTPEQNLAGDVDAAQVVDAALGWWARLPAGQPVFAFLHVYDVHYEYDPPAPYDTLFDRAPRDSDPRFTNYFKHLRSPPAAEQLEHQRAQYDEAIRYVDDQLARLAASLDAAGRAVSWVITADHGEEFGERGSWGHAHTLYPEQLHVPLVMSGARVSGGGAAERVVEQVVGLQDVAPTVAAWAGQVYPCDGVDLSPLLVGGELQERSFLADTSRFSTNRFSIYRAGWRLDVDLKHGGRELYHVAVDAMERHDLHAEEEARAKRMEQQLWASVGQPWSARSDVSLTASGAWFLRGDALHRRRLALEAGERFQLLPFDASVTDGSGGEGWRAVAGMQPGDGDPLELQTSTLAGGVRLTDDERQRLEALGYIQSRP